MATEAIEFGEVSNVYRLEREKRGELVKIPDDFFERLREHITELRRQAGVEEAKSQGSKRAIMLIEEVKKLSAMADQILDCRERKILMLAQSRANLTKHNLTSSERELVGKIIGTLDTHKAVLDGRIGARKTVVEAPQAEEKPSIPEGARPEVTVLQVLEDVGEFATAERDYTLLKSDVVSLPKEFAKVLIEKGKARELAVSQ